MDEDYKKYDKMIEDANNKELETADIWWILESAEKLANLTKHTSLSGLCHEPG